MENIDLIKIIDRIKNNNEYITDIAEELDINAHVILKIMQKHKNTYAQLLDYIKEDSKNRKENSIKNEIKKEIEKTLLINEIIADVNSGRQLNEIADQHYVSTSTYSKLLRRAGYVYDRALGGYKHSIFKDVEDFAKLMNGMDYEEEVENLFKSLYYEYIEEQGERASLELYNFNTKDIEIYHKLYDELEQISLNDGWEVFSDFIHYILLNYVYDRTGRDDSKKNEIQEIKDVEGFTTDEEIEVLKKNGFLYENDEVENELIKIYKSYLLDIYDKDYLDTLDCWNLFELFHKYK